MTNQAKETILIADDDPTTVILLSGLLKKWNFETIEVNNGQDAYKLLEQEEGPSMAILDWSMPKLDGPEICKLIQEKELRKSVYIMLLTSKSETKDIVEGLDSGAHDFIQKPFDANELKARIYSGVRLVNAERKLKEAKARMSEFVGIVSHDLRNPIGAIISIVEILDEIKTPETQELIKMISTSANLGFAIINELLDLTAIENSRIELKIRSYPLNLLFDNCKNISTSKADKKDVSLVFPKDYGKQVFMDVNRMTQVLDNLITNAIKFSDKGGEVKIQINENEDKIKVSVIDQGIGIPKDRIEGLFDKNVKSSTRGTHGESGTGFGLPLAQEIMKTHNGEIKVKSEVGQGSEFYFELLV